jgi:hypothetical protein
VNPLDIKWMEQIGSRGRAVRLGGGHALAPTPSSRFRGDTALEIVGRHAPDGVGAETHQGRRLVDQPPCGEQSGLAHHVPDRSEKSDAII